MSFSHAKKIGIASLIMMTSVFLSRVIGVFREMVISYIGGAKAPVDAYQIAFVLPEILNHILASGFLSITFIPIFSKYLTDNDEKGGWKIFSIVMTVFGCVLTVLILISMVAAEDLVRLIAPRIEDKDVLASAARMTRIILPAQIFFFAGGLLMAVQFAKEKFFLPALAPLVYNLGIIAGGIFLSPYVGMEGFSWGVLGGAFMGNFLLQYMGARKAGMVFFPSLNMRHPQLKNYIKVTIPLMIGLSMTFSTEFFLKYFGSSLPEGSIARLNYAFRVMLILVGFFGQSIGVAIYPFLSQLVSSGKKAEMGQLLANALKYMAIVIPFSALFMVLRTELIGLLFQHGKFNALDTHLTANALAFLLIGAIAFAAQTVVTRGFYAMQSTIYPTVINTITVVLCIPLFYLGTAYIGLNGLALAAAVSAIIQVIVLYYLWTKRNPPRNGNGILIFYLKVIAISLMIGAILEYARKQAFSVMIPTSPWGNLLICLLTGGLFLILLICFAWVFKLDEVQTVLKRLLNKFRLSFG
ncbi:MAG: murein biosynthesis integral membrane protein MurJ [Proteobacteria bacterium]|nr:murein biosynthesis integral membrane protein MurJ [Pseudomonadota bacterium]